MVALLLGIVLGLVVVCGGLLRWNEVRYRKKGLPPGTMGWPLIGENFEFLKQGPSFMKNQRARFGNLFRTHIFGCPTVICMDAELNRYIMMNESKGLVPGYPQSMLDIMGKWNIAAVHGPQHKTMRSAMLALISPTAIRDQLLPKIDDFMRSYLCNWNRKVIDIHEESKELWLHSALKMIANVETGPMAKILKTETMKLLEGTLSLPINFPGTSYSRGIQARKKLVSLLENLIAERRASSTAQFDMLDSLLRKDDTTKPDLNDEQIIDLVLTLIYSGFETVSTTIMMTVKYLHDDPKALEELRNEHFAIKKRKTPSDALDWNDYKSMAFTRAVIFETLRLATVVNGVLRKTTEDLNMEGFVIPKGWKIYVYGREYNYDPFVYPEPFKFNPWRYMHNNLESHQNFTQFGGGGRLCPGKELGIVEVSVFLHHFATKYSWKEVGENKLVKFPRVEAPNGLHIHVADLIG
ncbi:hypothetical protein Cni_G10172 [Canna indica]|uniref:Cytochrome P450 85A1 n=1 Tax=Canna indica TaxID=4628 RepID=A0AAQ3Q9N1_9LILI|nr:hypothetical protein Cni_G10172 [Canna indica]